MNSELRIKNKKGQARHGGQVALVVLLVSAVVMTMGLSLSRKTTVDTRIETNEEQLKQAFNAAESGIEYYLGTGKTNFDAVDRQSRADISLQNVGGIGTTINFQRYTPANSTVNYWLVAHKEDGEIDYTFWYTDVSFDLCLKASSLPKAVKVDYFYKDDLGVFKVGRYGFNLTADNIISGYDSRTLAQGSCDSGYVDLALALPAGGQPLMLAVKPIGIGTQMYLRGLENFPIQGIEITSVGKIGPAAETIKRQLKVVRTYHIPSFMTEAVTTYGNVLSN